MKRVLSNRIEEDSKWGQRTLRRKNIFQTIADLRIYAIIGVENQTDIHYAMPVRCMIYDALNYGKQVREAAKKHKKKKDLIYSEEFLSGFTKEDKLTPVITMTLYWGAEKWKAPRSIYEMFPEIGQDILKYVSDYKLNLIIPEEITDFDKFKTSLGAGSCKNN